MARPRKPKPATLTAPAGILPDHEGLPVIGSSITIPNAGGGLNDALTVDPLVLAQGEEAIVMMRVQVKEVRHPGSKDDLMRLIRRHDTRAIQQVVIPLSDGQAVGLLNEYVEMQREAIEKARAEGQTLSAVADLDGDEDEQES